ncbi:hypothetical protein EXIGLDRAFT_691566 [Exidia glandulosa HHB12029]|uniref:F-box domain-containing protein n=1 Tax=Exidia glandulosa HHB12029 TaxID=1314781 RepID=A0A165IJC6_EXIGL|nr:hypothetical protein EXIGLDRAFT_691566 [Exidia glandulosa HHB12029]
MRRLSADVLSCVFDFLGQRAMVQCASVSCLWRSIAVRHPNHYCRISFEDGRYGLDGSVFFHAQAFSDALVYTERMNMRVSIELVCARPNSSTESQISSDESDESDSQLDEADLQESFLSVNVFPALRRCMPRVVALDLSLCLPKHDFVLSALSSHPAPILRELMIENRTKRTMRRSSGIPPDLFAGVAPRLGSVALSFCALPRQPVAAFASVRKLEYCRSRHDMLEHLASNFPNLRVIRDCLLARSACLFEVLRGLTSVALTVEPRRTFANILMRIKPLVAVSKVTIHCGGRLQPPLAPFVAGIRRSDGPLHLTITFDQSPERHSFSMVLLIIQPLKGIERKFTFCPTKRAEFTSGLRTFRFLRPLQTLIHSLDISVYWIDMVTYCFDELPELSSLRMDCTSTHLAGNNIQEAEPMLERLEIPVQCPKLAQVVVVDDARARRYWAYPELEVFDLSGTTHAISASITGRPDGIDILGTFLLCPRFETAYDVVDALSPRTWIEPASDSD